jgi:hypothetical protein
VTHSLFLPSASYVTCHFAHWSWHNIVSVVTRLHARWYRVKISAWKQAFLFSKLTGSGIYPAPYSLDNGAISWRECDGS